MDQTNQVENKATAIIDAIGDIDDKFVAEAMPTADIIGIAAAKNRRYRRLATAAAVLLVVVIGGAVGFRYLLPFSRMGSSAPDTAKEALTEDAAVESAEENDAYGQDYMEMNGAYSAGTAANAFVSIDDLLGDAKSDGAENEVLVTATVPIGDYSAIYAEISVDDPSALWNGAGGALIYEDGDYAYWQITGHDDLQYLIGVDASDEPQLWSFLCFDSDETYPYRDVLETIYGITDASAITSVTLTASKFSNIDIGLAAQEHVGTTVLTDEKSIAALYRVLSNMTCYGQNHWEKINNGHADAPADEGVYNMPDMRTIDGMDAATLLSRDLVIETAWGNKIDALKYTAVGGQFYENAGIAYQPLSDADVGKVNAVFGIEIEN